MLQRKPNRREINSNSWELHSKISEELINTELSLVSTEQLHPNKSQNLKWNEYLKGKTWKRFEKDYRKKELPKSIKRGLHKDEHDLAFAKQRRRLKVTARNQERKIKRAWAKLKISTNSWISEKDILTIERKSKKLIL